MPTTAKNTSALLFLLVGAPLVGIGALSVMMAATEAPGRAAVLATISIVTSFALTWPLWRICARWSLPIHVSWQSVAIHFSGGLIFSATWVVLQYSLNPFRSRGTFTALGLSRAAPWQFLAGLWLYGIVIGISNTAQARNRAAVLTRRAIEAEASAARARLESLEARLNPHFLFNALHTLGALARDDATRTAAERLGDLLRYTLRKGTRLVAVRDELEFANNYLLFEQLRFEDRLRVKREIDHGALSCMIPAFSIQTLVENAVRHSIACRSDGGTVTITVRSEGAMIVVCVADDGGGRVAQSADPFGFGLAALATRVDAEFGPSAQVLPVADEEGYRVEIRVPRRSDSSSIAG
jgi:hypothetical protein